MQRERWNIVSTLWCLGSNKYSRQCTACSLHIGDRNPYPIAKSLFRSG